VHTPATHELSLVAGAGVSGSSPLVGSLGFLELQGSVEQKECSLKSRKKLQEHYSRLGQLTLSVEYDAVVMQPEICIGRWDRSPPLSLM